MEENSMVANDVEVSTTEQAPAVENSAEEITNPQKTQDVTQTQSFAKRLKEESKKQVEEFITSMGLTNEVTGEAVKTKEDYQRYMRTLKAQEEGKDVAMFNELEEAKSKYDNLQVEYNRLKRAEDIRALETSEEWKDAYAMYKDDVAKILEQVDKNPSKYPNVTPLSSLQALLVQQSPNKLIQQTKDKASNEVMDNIKSKAKASVGKLGTGEIPKAVSFENMTSEEFDKYLIMARRGDLKGKTFG